MLPAKVIGIPYRLLERMQRKFADLRQSVIEQMDENVVRGLTQIDYIVLMDKMSTDKLDQKILSLKK